MVDPQTRKLARQLVTLDERLRHLETVPQLAHSSIDDSALPVYDKDGNLVSQLGKQADGTWGAPPLSGPTPPAPTAVTAVGGAGIIHVRWPGTYQDGVQAPLDFDALEVLVDGALAGAMSNRDGGTVTIEAAEGTRYVSARVRSLVPRHSPTTSPFSVHVSAPAEILFEDMTERADQLADDLAAAAGQIAAAEQNLTELRDVTLPAMRAALDAEDAAAQAALTDLAARITTAEQDLQTTRTDLDDLQTLLDGTDLDALRTELAAALADITEFQDVTLPALQQRLADAEGVLAQLEGTDIGDMQVRLGDAESAVAELRDVTLPALDTALDQRIALVESGLRTDLDAATSRIDSARGDLDDAMGQLDAQEAALAEALKQASRGLVPPSGAPLGAHWVTPEGRLYVRIPCEGVA